MQRIADTIRRITSAAPYGREIEGLDYRTTQYELGIDQKVWTIVETAKRGHQVLGLLAFNDHVEEALVGYQLKEIVLEREPIYAFVDWASVQTRNARNRDICAYEQYPDPEQRREVIKNARSKANALFSQYGAITG